MNTPALSTSSRATSTMFTTTTTTPTVNSRSSETLAASSSSNTASAVSSPLSKPAVIGISVAAGVSSLALIGIILFFCVRKIKQRRRESDGFEIGGAMTEPPEFLYASMRNSGLGQGRYPRPDGGSAKPQPQLGSPFQPAARGPLVLVTSPTVCSVAPGGSQNAGMAISPATDNGDSPMSQMSRRTLSQLLPDKPDYTLDPERPNGQNELRPESNATVFEEDVERSKRVTGWPLTTSSVPNRLSGTVPFHPDSIRGNAFRLQADPRAMMYAKERQQNGLPTVRRVVQRNPVVYRTSSQQLKPAGDSTLQNQPGHVVQRHASRIGSIHFDGQWRGSRRWSRPPSGTTSSRRYSECSETSFEDEEIPSSSSLTVPKQQLTPVEEAASPFSTPEKQSQKPPIATGSPERYRRDAPRPAAQIAELDSVPVHGNQPVGRKQSDPVSQFRMNNPYSGFLPHSHNDAQTESSGSNRENRGADNESKLREANIRTNLEPKPRHQNLSQAHRTAYTPSGITNGRGPWTIRNLTPSR
ncbi:conserved hypothetical protein [Paecilomyces variotii No. 5]|uniref:Uncharacterized protein n=1 Tax=Byssochlamys spectabilis (strain No. 5 / NBRC 109023) TaxID=1356009 RepID=V5FY77_BYSSN|nr:conserved hypothetical protein [Paecilomyces variotii No. 5]